jgi:hypothetical protein
LYTSPNIVRVIQVKEDERDGAHIMYEREEKCINIFSGKLEGKRPHGKPRCRQVDNIRKDFREIAWEGLD